MERIWRILSSSPPTSRFPPHLHSPHYQMAPGECGSVSIGTAEFPFCCRLFSQTWAQRGTAALSQTPRSGHAVCSSASHQSQPPPHLPPSTCRKKQLFQKPALPTLQFYFNLLLKKPRRLNVHARHSALLDEGQVHVSQGDAPAGNNARHYLHTAAHP